MKKDELYETLVGVLWSMEMSNLVTWCPIIIEDVVDYVLDYMDPLGNDELRDLLDELDDEEE